MAVKKTDHISIADYLEHESAAAIKHEYGNGQILAMSGGTINHGVLCGNAYNELRVGLGKGKKNCRVIGSEVRIHIEATDSIVYPDTMVICGELDTSKTDKNAIINPILIVEVLSKSTGEYDRGDKFYKYRQLDSLKEYVLIEQEKPVVEIFRKKEDNVWEISRITGLDGMVEFKSIDVKVLMATLYLDIRWT